MGGVGRPSVERLSRSAWGSVPSLLWESSFFGRVSGRSRGICTREPGEGKAHRWVNRRASAELCRLLSGRDFPTAAWMPLSPARTQPVEFVAATRRRPRSHGLSAGSLEHLSVETSLSHCINAANVRRYLKQRKPASGSGRGSCTLAYRSPAETQGRSGCDRTGGPSNRSPPARAGMEPRIVFAHHWYI